MVHCPIGSGGLGRILLVLRRRLAVGKHQVILHAAGRERQAQGDDGGEAQRHFSFSCHNAICSRTLTGAVPPWLVREFTDASRPSTAYTSLVIPGSIDCISPKASLSRPTHQFLSAPDDAARYVMGVAERLLQHAHEPVGEIGGGRITGLGSAAHRFFVHGQVCDHATHDPKRKE